MEAMYCLFFSQKGIGKILRGKRSQDMKREGWNESYILIMGCQVADFLILLCNSSL